MRHVSKTDRRAMGKDWAVDSSGIPKTRWTRQTVERNPGGFGWDILGFEDRSRLARLAEGIPSIPDLPSEIPKLGSIRGVDACFENSG